MTTTLNAHVFPWHFQALATDRYEEGPDDEMGHRSLCKPPTADREMVGGLAFYSRDEEIALEAVAVARGNLEAKGLGAYYRRAATCQANKSDSLSAPGIPVSWRRVAEARADHQRLLVDFVDDALQTLDVPLLPRPAMLVDYVPYIQMMVKADDVLERLAKEEGGNRIGGRRQVVRQSSRLAGSRVHQYERYLTLQQGVDAARASFLVGWGET